MDTYIHCSSNSQQEWSYEAVYTPQNTRPTYCTPMHIKFIPRILRVTQRRLLVPSAVSPYGSGECLKIAYPSEIDPGQK